MATRNPRRPLPEVRNQLRPSTDWLGYICDMAKCPYNPNHVMKSHRLMRHVSKCEQVKFVNFKISPIDVVNNIAFGITQIFSYL